MSRAASARGLVAAVGGRVGVSSRGTAKATSRRAVRSPRGHHGGPGDLRVGLGGRLDLADLDRGARRS